MQVRRSTPSTEKFLCEFFATARPGSIPNDAFLSFDSIIDEVDSGGLDSRTPYDILDSLPTEDDAFVEALANELAKHPSPQVLLRTCFLLVGHSANKDTYVFENGVINIPDQAKAVSGDLSAATKVAETLREIGLHDVLANTGDARTVALGVRIGFQSDARKGLGGKLYEKAVEESLTPIVNELKREGYDIWLDREHVTDYKPLNKNQKKRVDFAILHGEKLLVAFEANCYTTGGSKLSSTEREYDDLSSKMRNNGTAFVWVTDGRGWESAQRVTLQEAYEDVHDVYNLHMVERELEDDLRAFLDDALKSGSGNTLSGY
jgi:hypothetical protein